SEGLNTLIKFPEKYDLVFDATSAKSHKEHWSKLKLLKKRVIDLTPSHIGKMIIPAINLKDCFNEQNINLISCGGQSGIPLAWAIAQTHKHLDYVEIVNTISSKSAGTATRINLDEYIETTEGAIKDFTLCSFTKTILLLNPAEPCINMKTTVSAIVQEPKIELLCKQTNQLIKNIQQYVPGYKMIVPPTYIDKKILITVEVQGKGDHLPTYAGNLDIITCAAIAVAEELTKSQENE
ncbi:MAG: acetaldehyde dehydrogenase (acetylating), partial [Lutibacter sp.]